MRRSQDPFLPVREDSSTNYGNTVDLLGANRADLRTLLWGRKESQHEGEWEQWVFSWRVRNVIAAPGTLVCPVARLTLGAGGSTVEAFINLVPSGDISLPSIVSKIDVMWDPDLVPQLGFVFPQQVTIDGIIRKGITRGNAKRAITRLAPAAATVPAVVQIPAFSQGLMITGSAIPYNGAVTYRFTDSSTYEFTGPEANANRATGRLFQIPTHSTTITVVTVRPGPTIYLGTFDFKIEL